jgi:undecaprenyl phosphate N,N'-diacetylbacillosamine 1-phosphate transferase
MLYLKRIIDLIASIIGIIFLSPLLFIIALMIKLDDRGPVFFSQERAGRGGRIFRVIKFRTMVMGAEKKGAGVFVLKDDPRITRVGKILRHTSLDELPQLFNILKGEMSVVGPRPALPYQIDNYTDRQKQRLKVKPGITGWSQVKGRSSLTWPERIEQDLWYIDNWSLWLDIKIFLMTVKVVFERENLYKPPGYDPISGEMKILDSDEDES